jgi:hypothetical protein
MTADIVACAADHPSKDRKEAIMPLVHVTLAEGTSQDRRTQIGDGIYRALIDVASVPEDD